jgi:hypothetical protein
MTEALDPEDDPGWPRGVSAFRFLIPGLLQRRIRQGAGDGLLLMRQVMESFSASLVLLGVVLVFIKTKSGSALPWIAILAVIAVASIVITRSVERPLDCASLITLARSYRTRFFLRIAFAQCVALFGFVFAFIGGPKWVYDAGAVFSLVRFWTDIAPTRSALADEQRKLEARGCALSLVAALRTTPPSAR